MKLLPPPPSGQPEQLRLIHVAPPGRRSRFGARWWQKWIGVVLGVLLLMWAVSGIALILPPSVAESGGTTPNATNWTTVVISPAQAVQAASRSADSLVRSVVLRRILDTMTYVVRLKNGSTSFVDATTGRTYSMTDSMAFRIATAGLSNKGLDHHITRVTARPAWYRGGLPAFRVELDDGVGTEVYVSESTAGVERTTQNDRLRDRIIRVAHRLEPLDNIRGGAHIRKAVIAAACVATIVYALLGFWLALPTRVRGTSR